LPASQISRCPSGRRSTKVGLQSAPADDEDAVVARVRDQAFAVGLTPGSHRIGQAIGATGGIAASTEPPAQLAVAPGLSGDVAELVDDEHSTIRELLHAGRTAEMRLARRQPPEQSPAPVELENVDLVHAVEEGEQEGASGRPGDEPRRPLRVDRQVEALEHLARGLEDQQLPRRSPQERHAAAVDEAAVAVAEAGRGGVEEQPVLGVDEQRAALVQHGEVLAQADLVDDQVAAVGPPLEEDGVGEPHVPALGRDPDVVDSDLPEEFPAHRAFPVGCGQLTHSVRAPAGWRPRGVGPEGVASFPASLRAKPSAAAARASTSPER
jgi:hypothetical protein